MQDEQWSDITDFSNYMISTHGEVYNKQRDTIMKPSMTHTGYLKISLIDDWGKRRTCSISLLMAQEFLPAPEPHFDSVIVLGDDLGTLHVSRLAWRPYWFAWKYGRQQNQRAMSYYQNLEVTNIDTGDVYSSIVEAALTEGLLFEDLWHATYTGKRVFPHGYTYKVTERV